uniref:Uncharacterized protein n=1 Tax=Arundo donax TaxID=35708 RepID=A0A0A8YG26_ARUDO
MFVWTSAYLELMAMLEFVLCSAGG